MAINKRKKHHDKDKYYHLAKEQGLRSRAAFKLTQINRKYPCLEKCETAVLDLCAAPGGWTQIAARTCPKSTHIVAVDILPIRSFKGFPNITTLVGDITTDKCKAEIRQAIAQGPAGGGVGKKQQVDLVLHDGAPNVGAEFGKDAYEQNELALHALRCATQHLRLGGTFITKIYRSRDYASYHWLLQQLFDDVAVFKPKASRQQSAEIFLVGLKYKAPAKIDPRLLDPKHVFEAVEGNTTGGGDNPEASSSTAISIFHKNYDKPKRQRSGYDMEFLDSTMRHLTPVKEFVSAGFKEAVQILGQSTGMEFHCSLCVNNKNNQKKGAPPSSSGKDNAEEGECTACSFLLHHPLTTNDIQANVSDLKVLNKSDFKALLNWRVRMQEALGSLEERSDKDDDDDDKEEERDSGAEPDSDKEEEEIQNEISEMRQRRLLEKKRKKKKERAVAAKRRRQAALGMDLNAIDVPDNDKLFSLASITSKGQLEAAAEVNLDQVTDDQVFGDSDDDVVIGNPEEEGVPEDETERNRRRERDLDEAYDMYLQNTKNNAAKTGSKMQKRSKKLQRMKVMEEAVDDQEMMLAQKSGIMQDTITYAKMLHGPRGSDDDSDDDENDADDESDDDDGFHAEPVTPEEHAALQKKQKEKDKSGGVGNPLIQKFDDEPSSAKAARWFSNPLFETIQKAAQAAASSKKMDDRRNESDSESSDANDRSDDDDESTASDKDGTSTSQVEPKEKQAGKEKYKDKKRSLAGLSAEDVLAQMPMTDKQKRHVKRLKQMAQDERKQARRAQKMNDDGVDFELAPADDGNESGGKGDEQLKQMSESERRKVLEAREQIKAGMGRALEDSKETGTTTFEVVGADTGSLLPVKDDRKYDSEHEDYDSDDYAETLALGTMLLRKSKEKAFLDASYNRYAWNDPSDLPDWFVDDEKKHYRPQLPIPPALLAKMKEKMMALATKPIQKVAEARARKNKRAKAKLDAAKKKAEAVANSSDLSDAMKLKAISKALRGQETKKPGKTYVVAKKGRGGNAGGKGIKLVDKRMKSDKRAADRIDKKRKKGKQNGLTGSKRRRHHK
ncbi:hypothetical protein ACA910_008903 [Epithemia clementina (nom. ined.)]